jgi:hypothetical protein
MTFNETFAKLDSPDKQNIITSYLNDYTFRAEAERRIRLRGDKMLLSDVLYQSEKIMQNTGLKTSNLKDFNAILQLITKIN